MSSSPDTDADDSRAADYETLNRRYTLAVNLECWELLAMHSIANDESIPRIRLRMMKAFAGLPITDANKNSAGSSPSSRKRPQKEANTRKR